MNHLKNILLCEISQTCFHLYDAIKEVKQIYINSKQISGPPVGEEFQRLYGNLGDDGDLYLDWRVATQVYIYYRIIEPYMGGGPI